MLWLLIPWYFTSEFSWNLIPKWEKGNLLNVKFAAKVNILFDSEWLFEAFPSARGSLYQLFTQLQWEVVQAGVVSLCRDPDAAHSGQLWHPNTALPCAVSPLQCTSGIYYTFSKNFSQDSILILNYYHLSPAQTGKKSFTQHTYLSSEKFPIYNLDSMNGENNEKGEWIPMALHNLHNDHEIMAQVTFVAYRAHPLFLIMLNFMNFLHVGFIVEVRFSGFLVKQKQKQTQTKKPKTKQFPCA